MSDVIVDVVKGQIVLRIALDLNKPGGMFLKSGEGYVTTEDCPVAVSQFINNVKIVDGKLIRCRGMSTGTETE